MAKIWQWPQCCHNLAARGVEKRGRGVENDPKNPHKTASRPKKRGKRGTFVEAKTVGIYT